VDPKAKQRILYLRTCHENYSVKIDHSTIHHSTNNWLLIPLVGICVFIVLYLLAASYYPGGSNFDRTHKGFDWFNNYWCDLISEKGKNGELNTGRGIALTAMIILFASLSIFWYYLPKFFHDRKLNKWIIRYTGISSMVVLTFIFTPYHDTIITIGGLVVAVPLIGTFRELYTHQLKRLFFFGVICLLFILLNFFSYITEWWILYLPMLQKITLLLFLIWIFLIDINCMLLLKSNKRDQLEIG